MEKRENKKKKLLIQIILFFIICTVVGISFLFQERIEEFINFKYGGDQISNDIATNGVVVRFIDVGQADAIAIDFPNGKNMLIDSGDNGEESVGKLLYYLNNNYFKSSDVKKFDYFVATHSDADHVGGADEVFDLCQINYVYYPDIDRSKTNTYEKFIDKMEAEPDCAYETHGAGDSLTLGDVSINFYTPFYNEITYKTNNNQSPIMILEYKGKKVMFTGDARQDLEKDMIEQYPGTNFDVDVLKIAHHGSSTSSCAEFLSATKPEYAVISVGEGNSYNHPNEATLERLKEAGVEDNCIYRTDKNGTIILSISNEGEIAFLCDNSTYTKVYVKWSYVAPGIIAISFVVIFAPNLKIKRKKKKNA